MEGNVDGVKVNDADGIDGGEGRWNEESEQMVRIVEVVMMRGGGGGGGVGEGDEARGDY